MSRIAFLSAGCIVLLSASLAKALVGDPQIMTDHPVYRGELACSTLDRNIADAYRVFQERYGHAPKTDTEKVIALWIWKCEHYMHACDNKTFLGTDNPDAVRAKDPPWLGRDGWMDNKDCQMNQFSFSFALCYSVHAQLSAMIGYALGKDFSRVRCPEITGHTPFEVFADGRWILADCTMGITMFDDDGKPVGLEEVYAREDAKDKAWFADAKRGGAYEFNMSPFGDENDSYSRVRWQQYNFGYNAMPIVYSLRAGESFTRYLDPGLDDGQTWVFWGRDYYSLNGKPKHGPYRNVTFLDDPPMGDGRKGRGKAYYGNGVFEYVPPLDGNWREGVKDMEGCFYLHGALRRGADNAYVIFEHVSPYVIAARPVEGGDREWNVLKEKCRDGAIITGEADGAWPVAVSVDGGSTWVDIGPAEGRFRVDFTDVVKGRHQYLLRFVPPSKGGGLKALKMRTVTQIGRGVFPRLKDGGTKVTYQAGGQSVIHGGPSQHLAEQYRRKDLEKDGYRVYQIQAPSAIRSASGAVRVADGGPWSVEFSLDGGKTWKAGVKEVKTGGAGEKQWDGGKAGYIWAEMEFSENKKAKDVLVRFGKGRMLQAQVFATYASKDSSSLAVTYGWTQEGQAKEHSHKIRAGKTSDSWTVPTGPDVKTRWVRFEAR